MDDLQLHHAVSQLLFREARLLDDGRFPEWLDLWTDDTAYHVPTTWDLVEGQREARQLELHHLRTGKDMLRLRVEKLTSGTAWAEEPRSRTVRTISNIEVRREGDELAVRSNVVLHRVRYTDDVEVHAARRSDRLVAHGSSWQIAARTVHLAHGVLRADNFEFFL